MAAQGVQTHVFAGLDHSQLLMTTAEIWPVADAFLAPLLSNEMR